MEKNIKDNKEKLTINEDSCEFLHCNTKEDTSLLKPEFPEKSKVLPQFMPHHQTNESDCQKKSIDLLNITNIQNINNYDDIYDEPDHITNDYYQESQLLEQPSKDFKTKKETSNNDSYIYENIAINSTKESKDSKTIVSASKTYEFDHQSDISSESMSIMNLNQNFPINDMTEVHKSNEKTSKSIFKKDCISLEANFPEQLSNSKNHCTDEAITKNNIKNDLPLNLPAELDHASSLFKTADSDELFFFQRDFRCLRYPRQEFKRFYSF